MIGKLVNQYYEEALKIRHELHRFPELSHKEYKTTALIRSCLTDYGVEVLDYPIKTGVIARIHGDFPGPVIALREDIDALPISEETGLPFTSEITGVSHACGHDVHTAVLLLVSRVLAEVRNKLYGSVLLVFQPAEETCDGAVDMLTAGVLKTHAADVIVGLHCSPSIPLGKVGIISGMNNASCDVVQINITGKGGHGAHPETCVDPIMTAAILLAQLQVLISREIEPQKAAVLTFGQIKAGEAPNIIPDSVILRGTLRTLDSGVRKHMLEAIPRMASGCCQAMRAQCEVIFENGMPPLINAPEITEQFIAASENSLGKASVCRIENPSVGSDDFSCLLEQCENKGGQFLIGTYDRTVPETGIGLHSSKNIFPDAAIRHGAAVLCRYVMETLNK